MQPLLVELEMEHMVVGALVLEERPGEQLTGRILRVDEQRE